MIERGGRRNSDISLRTIRSMEPKESNTSNTMNFHPKTNGRRNSAGSKSLELRSEALITSQALSKRHTIHQIYFDQTCFGLHSVRCQTSKNYDRKSFYREGKLNTRLLDAVEKNADTEVDRLLKLEANPNATCRLTRVSVCHLAAMADNDLLSLLIKSGAETCRTDRLGRTPLHLAAWAGNLKQVAILLNLPAVLQERIGLKMSEDTVHQIKLHSTVKHRLIDMACNIDVLTILPSAWHDSIEHNCTQIKENLPVFAPGWTALHSASSRAQFACVQLLLAAGANTHARDYIGRAPLDVVGEAYYSGHNIDVFSFKETIRILLSASAKFYGVLNDVNTPLHTAVELESLEAIEVLLHAGVSTTRLDSNGITAMHICVRKQLREHLQLLIENCKYNDQNSDSIIVNAQDRMGQTVLHSAVKDKWCDGVCIALGAGANIFIKADDGESPIHSAAALGDTHILQEILAVARYAIDYCNQKGQNALCVAIINNHLEIVKILMENGASLNVTLPGDENVLHVVAQHGHAEILEYILKYGGVIINKLLNEWATHTPTTYAILNNFPECVNLLLSKGAMLDSNIIYDDHCCTNCYTCTTDLHIAAANNYYEIVEIILNYDNEAIHKTNEVGLCPIHVACLHGSRESIKLLIYYGADLSTSAGHLTYKPTPIKILMNNLSKPTECLEAIFDLSIFPSEEMNIEIQECEVYVNYQILWPNSSNMKQLKVIKALVDTGNRFGQRKLLQHPLIESFLHLKWKALLPFFYIIILLYWMFLMSLNMYVLSVFYYKDKQDNTHDTIANETVVNASQTTNVTAFVDTPSLKDSTPFYLQEDVWKYLLYFTVSLITLQEIVFITIRNKRYFFFLETWIKFGSIILSMLLPSVVWYLSDTIVDPKSSIDWARLMATLAVLLTWLEMMFLLSRFPNWGFYVLMFAKVAKKVLKILLTFLFLIFGFSVSFMILCHGKPPFDTLWAAITKSMVMMMSEYDYVSMIDKEKEQHPNKYTITASIVIIRVIFMIFVILASIVLMNLMVGVAVNDVNLLEEIGNQMRLEKQVEFLSSLEDIVWNKKIQKFLPNKVISMWKQVNVLITLGPEKIRGFPIHIRDAIFEKAQLRRDQMDKQQELQMNYPKKLNEIHEVVAELNRKVKQADDKISITTFNETVDKFNKQIEDLRKEIINQLTTIKQVVDKNATK